MSDPLRDSGPENLNDAGAEELGSRMSVPEIARRLGIGRVAVYMMLEKGILPGIRVGRRWLITRHVYEQWERTCGTQHSTLLPTPQELKVLN